MAAPPFTMTLDGIPVLPGAAIAAVPGPATLLIHPGPGGWPVLPGAPRVPFLTLLLEGGLSMDGAFVGGQALQAFAVPFGASGQSVHPFAPTSPPVSGPPGGTLVAVRLPYGLTVPGSHPDISAQLRVSGGAAAGVPLRLSAAVPDGAQATLDLMPTTLTLAASIGAPEAETVAGALQEVTVHAHAASGVAGLVLQTSLPPGVAFAGAALLGGTGNTSFDAASGLAYGQFTQLGDAPRMVVQFRALAPGLLEGSSRGVPVAPGQAAAFPSDGVPWAVSAKPLTLRSSVVPVGAAAPGQPLEWTLAAAISSSGASALRITDTLGNGQRFDGDFAPQLRVLRGGVAVLSSAIAPTVVVAADGASTLEFDVSAATSGVWSLANSTVEVVFRSVVGQLFGGTRAGQLVGQGDQISNAAILHGTVRGAPASDGTSTSLALPGSTLRFSIYAVNGVLVQGPVRAAIGDAVTYRVQAGLPLTTARGFAILASGPGPLGGMAFDASPGIPPAGRARFGPDGSYTANAPVVQATADGAIRFDFGHVLPVYGNGAATLDLLYTARLDSTASDPGAPEAQAWLQESNMDGVVHHGFAAAGLTVEPPLLRLQTASLYASNDDATWTGTGGPFGYSPWTGQFGGTITSAGLAAEPFSDVLYNVDAGDEVTFVIAVESLTAGPAYGVVLHNAVPSGFVVPPGGADVVVMDGDGTLLDHSGNLFDPAMGLMLAAPVPGYDASSGLNIVLVTFTLRTPQAMAVPAQTASVARLLAYRAEPGADNLVATQPGGTTASTGVVTVQPAVSIVLASTSLARTPGSVLAPGETATFAVTVTLPEGQAGALTLDHLLPGGMEFVSASVLRMGANLSAPAGVTLAGRRLIFGAIANTPDNRVSEADRIVLELVARAGSVPFAGGRVSVVGATDAGGPSWSGADYAEVSVVTPRLTLRALAPSIAQPGQAATFTLILSNAPGAEAARDVRLTDLLAPGLEMVPGSISAMGTASASVVAGAGVSVTLARLDPGETLTLTFQARVLPGTADGAVLGSTASVTADGSVAGPVRAEAAASLRVVAPAVSMTLVGTAGLRVGDVATYRIAAALPEGTSPSVTVRGLLPAGLDHRLGSVRVVGAGVGLPGLAAPAVQVDGQTVSLAFGAVDALASGDRSILIEFQASMSAAAPLGLLPSTATLGTGYAGTTGGVAVTAINSAPVLSALPALLATPDTAEIALFSPAALADPNANQVQTIRITLSDPSNGSLTGAVRDADGTYRITGDTVAANAALAGVRFVPALHRAAFGVAVRTGIAVSVGDGAGGQAFATTEVSALTTNTAPTLAGLVAGQSTTLAMAVLPFATLALWDRDARQVSTLAIRMSDPAHGRLMPSGIAGTFDEASGTFRMVGLLPDLQAAARALAYLPNPAAADATLSFAVMLNDGAGGSASSNAAAVHVAPRQEPALCYPS